jgi:hypothetical protein
LGKPGNKKSTKQITTPVLGRQEIKFFENLTLDEALNEWPAENACQLERHPGADGQADGGEYEPNGLAVNKPARRPR